MLYIYNIFIHGVILGLFVGKVELNEYIPMKSRFIILDDKHSHSRLQMKPYNFVPIG